MNTFYAAALTALLAASPDAGAPSLAPLEPTRLVDQVNNQQCLETSVLGLDRDNSFPNLSNFNGPDFEAKLSTAMTKKGYLVLDQPDRDSSIPVLLLSYQGGPVVLSLRDSQKVLHWRASIDYLSLPTTEDMEKVIPPPCARLRKGEEEKQGGYGYLRINSQPFSDVWIDGKYILGTPVMKHRVTVGKHTVTLKNDRFRCEGTYDITVKAGETVALVKKLECQGKKE